MGLFGFGKKKKNETKGCCCGGNCSSEQNNCQSTDRVEAYSVKILGSGCAKCNELEEHTVEALKTLGMNSQVEHITDFTKIASYGVMSTPALVVDEKVVSYGKVLKTEEVIKILEAIK
jgi:small redox-active disulfide protein 2